MFMSFSVFFNIPSQNHGVNGHHDFGSKKDKSGRRKALGKHISQLITHGNILDLKILSQHLFSNKMVVYLYMFGARMENRV